MSKKSFVVFARANAYDPSEFADDHVAVAAFDDKADADVAFPVFSNPDRLTYKDAFLLEVTAADDFDANDVSHQAFDDTFRKFFPQFDVSWVELDSHSPEVDGRVEDMKIVETNADTDFDDEPLDEDAYESMDGEVDDEELKNILTA